MRRLGRIVRLQVQVAPLKHGERPDRGYDTGRIRRVASLEVSGHGVVGSADHAPERIVDVHHRDHPESRYRGDNGISLLTTGHYALMRERFGSHVHDGIAAESVLVERPGWLELRDLAGGVEIVPGDRTGDAERLLLDGASPAQPCLEFSRLVSGVASGSLRDPLVQLRDGMRGYYLQVACGPARCCVRATGCSPAAAPERHPRCSAAADPAVYARSRRCGRPVRSFAMPDWFDEHSTPGPSRAQPMGEDHPRRLTGHDPYRCGGPDDPRGRPLGS